MYPLVVITYTDPKLFSRESLQNVLQSHKQTVYVGVDPTAKSLHIGHLIPFMCLLHFQLRGHKIIPLVSFYFLCHQHRY